MTFAVFFVHHALVMITLYIVCEFVFVDTIFQNQITDKRFCFAHHAYKNVNVGNLFSAIEQNHCKCSIKHTLYTLCFYHWSRTFGNSRHFLLQIFFGIRPHFFNVNTVFNQYAYKFFAFEHSQKHMLSKHVLMLVFSSNIFCSSYKFVYILFAHLLIHYCLYSI